MQTRTLPVAEARSLVIDTLIRCGTAPQNAASVAEALIGAELTGQYGHGLRRVPLYAGHVLSGRVDGHAAPRVRKTRPGTLLVDAMNGFAYPAMDLALAELPQMARENGIAMAGIGGSHHCGVAGLPVEALARQGCIAIFMANAPAAMAPWGGRRPIFGTDPIAFAAPLDGAEPVVVDISLSKVAKGKVMAAVQRGEPIPEGWALDADGNPTTDAAAAMKGTMVPMGEAKGTALAIMVEMLCAGLTGANFAYEAPSFFALEGDPMNTGQAILVIDATAMAPGATARFAELASQIEGMEGARLPGRRRQQIRRDLLTSGIEVDDSLYAEIEALGR
ncbi:Ldh family oxidoreductase [Oceanicola sp. S124]|uniref:Ldh family oxidoreductase n=1 Tax=Oceanicola sp. S124 TaxID=1042378 RepID=UPI00025593B8|nr:Ldh family oxidoreductase [Oceanicola sp. S124]